MPLRERQPAEARGDGTPESRPASQNNLHNQTGAHEALRSGERREVEAYRSDRQSPPAPNQTFALSSATHTDPLDASHMDRLMADNPRVGAKLVIERGGRVGKEFPITGIETNIGRWDADSGIFPDVDLDEDDPEAKVSRRHARIVNHSGQYFIEDLGSTNGTFVNRGRRLLPGKRQSLQNGDEIIVGKTFLKFQILR
jgi:pSer/pThr/pTyr-binding forkhead associated (FHA) protein